MNIDFSFSFKHFTSLPDKGGNTAVPEILRLKSLHFLIRTQNLKDSNCQTRVYYSFHSGHLI